MFGQHAHPITLFAWTALAAHNVPLISYPNVNAVVHQGYNKVQQPILANPVIQLTFQTSTPPSWYPTRHVPIIWVLVRFQIGSLNLST